MPAPDSEEILLGISLAANFAALWWCFSMSLKIRDILEILDDDQIP
jgi:hypothetical protein